MPEYLPPSLVALFAPRPPIEFKPPPDELLVNRKRAPIQGVAQFVNMFENPSETPPKPVLVSKEEKREKMKKEKQELLAYKIEQGIAMWAPAENPKATMDPYKTLFVARINYETSESKLRREFEKYGKILKISMVHDKNGKPRGYAFIEYANKSDMTAAYKKADGMKIDGRRVVVDYERGRTQKQWLPRRLGGGKGDTRRTRLSKAALLAKELEEETRGVSPFRDDEHNRRSGSSRRSRSRSRSRDRSSRDGHRSSRNDRHQRERDRSRR
ncbi:RNA recognition motif domain-containing protein [Ditylenchus destructor]|uniref:U1 small nuclear ribonucleoprotein 70 kDa n=1 Tax=Ditylenchus destructor TaxID=166010 RepID=A0AAD4N9B6_9BILA|nr:RNA recognition motif domain-containing protein [Ditylenchus destructor]